MPWYTAFRTLFQGFAYRRGALVTQDYDILDADSAQSGEINARLHREDHPRFKLVIGPRSHMRTLMDRHAPNLPDYFRTVAAAKYIGVSPRTLEAWRLRGGGPPFHKPKGARIVLYRRDELDAWAGGSRSSTSQAEPDAA